MAPPLTLPRPTWKKQVFWGLEETFWNKEAEVGMCWRQRQAQWVSCPGLLSALKSISFSEATDTVTACVFSHCQRHSQTGTGCPLAWPLSPGSQEEVSSNKEAALPPRCCQDVGLDAPGVMQQTFGRGSGTRAGGDSQDTAVPRPGHLTGCLTRPTVRVGEWGTRMDYLQLL